MSKSQIWAELKNGGNPDGLRWRDPKDVLLQSLNLVRQAEQEQKWARLADDVEGVAELFEQPKQTVIYTAFVTLSGKQRTINGQVRVAIGQDPEDIIDNQLGGLLDAYGQKIDDDYEIEYEVEQVGGDGVEFIDIELDGSVYIHHDANISFDQRQNDCALYAVWGALQKSIERQDIKAVSLQDIMAVLDRKYVKGANTLTIGEIKILCKHFNINVMVADATGKVVLDEQTNKYKITGRTNGYLHFIAHMGHCYTIDNAKAFTNSRKSGWTILSEDKGISSTCLSLNIAVDVALTIQPDNRCKNPSRIFVNCERFSMKEIFDIMIERKVLFSINSIGEEVRSIKFRGTTIFACPNLGQCRSVCDVEKIKFIGQDMGAIGRAMFEKYSDVKCHSELSIAGQQIFNDKSVRPCNFGNSNSEAAFDISKCYTHCLSKIAQYPVYTVFDEPEIFGGEIKLGFYYVKTTNTFPFAGNGWYGSNLVSYAIDQKIELTITHQYIPQYGVDNPYIKLIDRAVKSHPQYAKMIINYFIGTLNCSPRVIENIIVTNSSKEYVHYINKFEDCNFSREGELFRVGYTTPAKVSVISRKPLYSFIIDQGKIEVHKLAKTVGGDLVGVRTDCVYVSGNYTVPQLGAEVGDYRVEETKDAIIGTTYIATEAYEMPISIPWRPVRNTDRGRCIDGAAGTGKSWLINNMDSKAQRCAFTNAAALNIKGRTLHSVFSMRIGDNDTKVNDSELIVDEYSMIPESLFAVLLKKKQSHPTSKIILSGDSRQIQFIPRSGLAPIKAFPRVNDTVTFRYLCDYQLETLTECKRANNVYFNACLSGAYDSISRPAGGAMVSVNIVRTNIKRAILNQKFNKSYARVAAVLKTIHNYDFGKEITGTLDVCEGSRWIADSRNKKLGFVKNEFYDIVDGKLKSVHGENVVSLDELKNFSLRWAFTINKAQGQTIRRKFAIHEFGAMDERSRYTSVTRGTKVGQFQIYR